MVLWHVDTGQLHKQRVHVYCQILAALESVSAKIGLEKLSSVTGYLEYSSRGHLFKIPSFHTFFCKISSIDLDLSDGPKTKRIFLRGPEAMIYQI